MRPAQGRQAFVTSGVWRQWLLVNFPGLPAQKEGDRKSHRGEREADSSPRELWARALDAWRGPPRCPGKERPCGPGSCSAPPRRIPASCWLLQSLPGSLQTPTRASCLEHRPVLPPATACSSLGCQGTCSLLPLPHRPRDATRSPALSTSTQASSLVCPCKMGRKPCAPPTFSPVPTFPLGLGPTAPPHVLILG